MSFKEWFMGAIIVWIAVACDAAIALVGKAFGLSEFWILFYLISFNTTLILVQFKRRDQ